MEKTRINRFISKYNLAGLVESVKWESKEGSLSTNFISDDKSVLGTVTLSEFDFEDLVQGFYLYLFDLILLDASKLNDQQKPLKVQLLVA